MKIWKTAIRVWFTLVSLISFLVGWIVLAHSPKPNQFKASDIPAMPKLKPVPSLEEAMFSGRAESLIQINPRTVFLRTSGS
ncbi:MAG TPA: hypothetical protein PKE35_08865 [Anaerolineales bacterium]|nr:hypothetical protein [Anaerolineales bacterium]HMX74354.1 hypothetical protein [Anaerolineales bacterium]HMZ44285.1 hypothetical protein [Anaerolineales bacterium]HNA54313.1 hypothetical protein [Anaerolineales bacterium]HNB86884.1 hypothetical protein [Anaerolineales bacterium]